MLERVRRLAALIRKTPLHPQWFAYVRETRNLSNDCAALSGTVLDVGCAERLPHHYLPPEAHYIGLDYYSTAVDWYGTKPDIFGDAHALPIATGSLDHVLLLDVLEHLANPERCLSELSRVLKDDGTLVIQVPFMYPIHDAPLDFHRWTGNGLALAAARYGFSISSRQAIGHPLETAALNANIAFSKSVLNWISSRNPLLVTAIVLPLFVLATNCSAWLLAALSREDDFMPYAYRMVWTKR